METKKFIWFTYRDWSFEVLRGLTDLEGWDPALIITTTDCKYDFSDFKNRGIEILRVDPKKDLKLEGIAYKRALEIQPATMFHYGWSWIVPNNMLEMCPNVTLHPGKLPRDRGGSPLQNQIRNGEEWSYANVLEMSEKLDDGPIYLREKFSLMGDISDVWSRMVSTGTYATREYLKKLHAGDFKPTPQSDEEPTFYNRVKAEQAELKPTEMNAKFMYNIIRAHNETDPNTYVVKAYYKQGADLKLTITKATCTKPNTLEDTVVLNVDKGYDIYEAAHLANNGELNVAIKGADEQFVYLQNFFVDNTQTGGKQK